MPTFNVYTEVTVTEKRVYQVEAQDAKVAGMKVKAARFNLPFDTFDSTDHGDEHITAAEETEE